MASLHRTEALSYEAMRDLNWSPKEKAVARKAFNQALQRELEAAMVEAKKRAARIRQPSELWELERYLAERRVQIDREYEYKYSVLIFVLGNLVREGMLSEQELQGLNQDKLDSIRRYALL
jgi:Photoprotection regulator fluorescence recovery protein